MANKPKWQQISKEEFEEIVKTSHSIMEVGKKLGYTTKSSGGTASSIKKGIEFYGFDISHFKGQGWKKGDFDTSWMTKGNQYYSRYSSSLINLRGRKCEHCGLTGWQGSPIPIEVHHKDGDKTNNESENLELLCPNCHFLTDGFRGRK